DPDRFGWSGQRWFANCRTAGGAQSEVAMASYSIRDTAVARIVTDYAPKPVEVALPWRDVRLESSPVLLVPRSVTRYERLLKPAIDRVLALAALVVLTPIMLMVAIAVCLSLGRPIFFRQTRVGRDES